MLIRKIEKYLHKNLKMSLKNTKTAISYLRNFRILDFIKLITTNELPSNR